MRKNMTFSSCCIYIANVSRSSKFHNMCLAMSIDIEFLVFMCYFVMNITYHEPQYARWHSFPSLFIYTSLKITCSIFMTAKNVGWSLWELGNRIPHIIYKAWHMFFSNFHMTIGFLYWFLRSHNIPYTHSGWK
jgi:hypothetical protein